MGDGSCAIGKVSQIMEQHVEYRIIEEKTFSEAEAKLNELSAQGYRLTANILHDEQTGYIVAVMVKGSSS
jgi:hypothetical protein